MWSNTFVPERKADSTMEAAVRQAALGKKCQRQSMVIASVYAGTRQYP